MTLYLKPKTLDALAEAICNAALQTVDEDGKSCPAPPNIAAVPQAVVEALNVTLGWGNWAALGTWPCPEQLESLKAPEAMRPLLEPPA